MRTLHVRSHNKLMHSPRRSSSILLVLCRPRSVLWLRLADGPLWACELGYVPGHDLRVQCVPACQCFLTCVLGASALVPHITLRTVAQRGAPPDPHGVRCAALAVFRECGSLTDVAGLANWDTSQATDFNNSACRPPQCIKNLGWWPWRRWPRRGSLGTIRLLIHHRRFFNARLWSSCRWSPRRSRWWSSRGRRR
jgi:surface protein